jgi:hypothetical protein
MNLAKYFKWPVEKQTKKLIKRDKGCLFQAKSFQEDMRLDTLKYSSYFKCIPNQFIQNHSCFTISKNENAGASSLA